MPEDDLGDGENHPLFFLDERTIQLASRLNVFGLCLLLAYLVLVVGGALPLQLLSPAWQVGLTGALIDNAPIALLGLVLLHLAAFFDPEDEKLQQRVFWLARLSILASLGFLLLIPLRAYNLFALSEVAGNAQERRLTQANTRLNDLRNAVRTSSTKEQLLARLKALNAPPLPPALQILPLDAIRADMNRSFDRMAAALKQRRQQPRQPRPVSRTRLVLANVRQMIASFIFAVAFAAAGQRSTSPFTFLDDLRNGLRLPTLSFSVSINSGKGEGRGGVDDHVEDYMEMIGAEPPPAPPKKPPGS